MLVSDRSDDDVIIRPTENLAGHHTTWLLSRPDAARVAMKMRIEVTNRPPEQRVHDEAHRRVRRARRHHTHVRKANAVDRHRSPIDPTGVRYLLLLP